MSGYTPIFASVFDGTLHGRWPHTGIWVCLLAMADRHGRIDKIPRAIAADIGVDVETLQECINDFCQPDPDSRSSESDGRRLELIDPARPWGWQIINHSKYREKARKAASDAERVATGREAERKRQERASRAVPPCPAMTRADPPSDSDTDSNTEPEKKGADAPRLPKDLNRDAWAKWLAYRRKRKHKPPTPEQAEHLAKFPRDRQLETVELSIRNGWQGLFPEKTGKGRADRDEIAREKIQEWINAG